MMEPIQLRGRNEQLMEFLRAAIGHFRNGEDTLGMEAFLSGAEELERVVEIDQNSQQPRIDLDQLLPAMRELYFYMQNQDITGMTDFLEDAILPLTNEWLKGRDDV